MDEEQFSRVLEIKHQLAMIFEKSCERHGDDAGRPFEMLAALAGEAVSLIKSYEYALGEQARENLRKHFIDYFHYFFKLLDEAEREQMQ